LSIFDPLPVTKHQRRLPGFNDRVISMYARGMPVREIQAHLEEIYGLKVSPEVISTITDEVMLEVAEWQSRALEAMYPIVYFNALCLKIRDEGTDRTASWPHNRRCSYRMRQSGAAARSDCQRVAHAMRAVPAHLHHCVRPTHSLRRFATFGGDLICITYACRAFIRFGHRIRIEKHRLRLHQVSPVRPTGPAVITFHIGGRYGV
jgi:hypothetical protein